MKYPSIRLPISLAAAVAFACAPVGAEDIDLFTSPGGTQHIPNVVIMIDNSANWDANNQHWPGVKQGQSELRALRQVVNEVADGSLNLGLMLFTPGVGVTPDGAYVRFHVRPMNATNKSKLSELIGSDTPACVDGANSLNGTPNCIFKNFSTPTEKVGTAKTDYSAGLFEVFKYFGGYTDPARARSDVAGTPVDASHFGALRYARNGAAAEPNSDPAAYTGVSKTGYNPAIDPLGSACAKNFLVFIGNGFPVKDSPSTLLAGVNGSTTNLPVQTYNTTSTTSTTTLGTDATCTSPTLCATNAATAFPGYDSYACTGGAPQSPVTNLGTDAVCESNAACVTRATALSPGHVAYSCSGGTSTPVGSATGTDKACESAASCGARASTILPGYSSYGACSGGTSGVGASVSGADPVTESRTACIQRAKTTFPGYTTYNCTGGTAGTATSTALGASGVVCESIATCQTRMATANPGHDTITCSGGSGGPFTVGTDLACENATLCKNAITFPAGSNLTGAVCSGGTACGSGGKFVNQAMQGSCAVGAKAQYGVTATDTPYTGQTMQASGCTAPNLSGQTFTAFNTCLSNQAMQATDSCIQSQSITGTKTVITITPTGTPAPPTTDNNADEWAKYLYTTDVNAALGQQNVVTYTIDVYKDAPDANETALLQSMAKYGGGRYFQASSENAIVSALRQILVEIQSVNSVFASASLPINATNRSQNENQVFIGMFRPDSTGLPRWYGNLKHYQVALFGSEAKLADVNGNEAIAATTGFIQACATSFYTADSGANTWNFSPSSAGTCTAVANSTFNDLPDGGVVEKGAAAEILRRGNSTTATAPFSVTRQMLTCATSPCAGLVTFDTGSVTQARTGAATAADNTNIVDFTKGKDVFDENGNANVTEPRASIHGDIAHSRPLPVNFGGSRGVEVIYGSNDGALHAMKGNNGTELWSFVAPEHHSKLKRLMDNTPLISYPGLVPGTPSQRKDYFFDGSAGLYQNADSSKVWVFPTMRRGGRMIYAFDISASGPPLLKWVNGCPSTANDTGCTAGMTGIGQTWSVPSVGFVKGYNSGTDPVIIVGGGYDTCEDTDAATTSCTSSTKGNKVYVIDANTGTVIRTFDTDRSVPADVTLVDRDFDGKVDHVYVADTGGNLYRLDFVDPASCTITCTTRTSGAWTMSKIAQTSGANRKFLFGPAALSAVDKVYLAVGTGDRERPLITNYPYTSPVRNRFYMFIDSFPASGIVDLDGAAMNDFSSGTDCSAVLGAGKTGWFMDLTAGTGEQLVTSSVIFGGTVFFSTNRPVPTPPGSCATNLGEARGYAVNLLNASGVIGTGQLCGGSRSGTFTGGGLPPSPVVGTVPVRQADGTTKPISVLIGGINVETGTGSPIGAQQPPVPIKSIRSRTYWYPRGDK